jgi:hypothetical protein
MNALSLYQPHAAAYALGLKRNETRSWKTSFRGRIAIHATKVIPAENARLQFATFQSEKLDSKRQLVSSIIGICEIVDCVRVEEIRDTLSDQERELGDYSDGRFAWISEKHQLLREAIPCRGARRIWKLPPITADLVELDLDAQSRALVANLQRLMSRPKYPTSLRRFRSFRR